MTDQFTAPRARIDDLRGKAILVTGASSGIGAAVAYALACQGGCIGVHYNANEEAARRLADAIATTDGTAVLIRGDVSIAGESERVVEEAAAALGGLDGLINNAGSMLGRVPTDEASDTHLESVVNLNVRSVLAATRAAVPHLRRGSDSFIINTSSIAARNGGSGGAVLYAAAKGFVSTLTHGQAKEFAPYNIRVNAVAPGVITTAFHERYSSADQLAAMRTTVPLGRLGAAEDCVGAYLYLASHSLSGYVTGQVIEVNGGQLMP